MKVRISNNGMTAKNNQLDPKNLIRVLILISDVWRFPFTAYENGGGAFLIPYLIVLFFIGRPLYFMELSMGQFASKSSVKVWDMVPGFRGQS